MNLSAEQQALLALLRTALGCASAAAPPPAGIQPDWDAVLAMARYHGIAPLLHAGLGARGARSVPPHVSSALAGEFFSNAALHLLHQEETARIAGCFRDHGLACAFLKGLALATLVYPEPEWRPCGGDIDILIRSRDYRRAKSALGTIGYFPNDPRSEAHELAFVGEAEFSCRYGEGKPVVDVHTDFNANSWGKVSGFDMEGCWGGIVHVERGGVSLPVLPPDAQLLFLAVHAAANHVFDRLIILCDLDLLVRKHHGDIDWLQIARHARARGGAKALYLSLAFCAELLSTPVPAPFLRALRPGALSRSLVPARALLLRGRPPPKALHRYMHLVLLDRPELVMESLRFFVKRVRSERSIRKPGRRPLSGA